MFENYHLLQKFFHFFPRLVSSLKVKTDIVGTDIKLFIKLFISVQSNLVFFLKNINKNLYFVFVKKFFIINEFKLLLTF